MKKGGTDVAPKRERVPQAERRRITRGKLLDATIESLIDIGYPRTTTVEVGERPLGVLPGGRASWTPIRGTTT